VVTLMYVLTVKSLPPQVPARAGCVASRKIDGTVVIVRPPPLGDVDVVPVADPGSAAIPVVAQQRATIPVQAMSAAALFRKR